MTDLSARLEDSTIVFASSLLGEDSSPLLPLSSPLVGEELEGEGGKIEDNNLM
jgi:hypothetical protein